MSSGLRLELLRGGLDEDGLEILGGVDRGVADHEGDARRIGAVVLGRDGGVGGDDADAVERNVQRLGHGDRHHGGGALADIGGAGERRHAAVEVQLEVDHRVRLAGPVDRLGGAADIMRAGHAEALARRQLAEALAPAAGALDLVEAFRQSVAVDHQIVHACGSAPAADWRAARRTDRARARAPCGRPDIRRRAACRPNRARAWRRRAADWRRPGSRRT